MQVDQFESEVESLSVQTRKKQGDKEVSASSFLLIYLFLQREKSIYKAIVFCVFSCRSKIVLKS